MESDISENGTIITFYSYKGGTGRSMALANIACLIGEHSNGRKALAIDWDLEAPGLHRFFADQSELSHNKKRPGIIDYFHKLRHILETSKETYTRMEAEDGAVVLDETLPIDDFIIRDVAPGVDFIKAGTFNERYAELVGSFDWVGFYDNYGVVLTAFRNLLMTKYAYCLIDSRTGLTDTSGVCTMLLPEKLVTVFTPNRQNLSGLMDLVPRVIDYRRWSDDMRPLTVFPLPSRIENAEQKLRQEWRIEYQSGFEERFSQHYEVEECDLSEYFNEVRLPQLSYYAYGEKIAVLEERSEAHSLHRSYEAFFQRLVQLDYPWQILEEGFKRKTAVEAYDVFLSYHPSDSEFVEQIAARLQKNDIRCYFAKWHLMAGDDWREASKATLKSSSTAAVFVGRE